MSAVKAGRKTARSEASAKKPEKRTREEQDSFDHELSSEIKGIMSALHQIKEKAKKDGQKKHEEIISSVSSEVKSMFDEMKTKIEKDRLAFMKSLAKSSKECESIVKEETAKFHELYEKFSKDKTAHLQAVKDAMSKLGEDKEKLMKRYEQQRRKDRTMLMEHEKASTEKIAALERSLKKTKTKEVNPFNFLRKMIVENASDEDFPGDDVSI